ncbi:DUF732 domain-containing protein [Mycolicibacterium vulneris]|nr:DUF732 domain-containing protein [Mycolicibacterium vulneris]
MTIVLAAALGAAAATSIPRSTAAPAPQVEYLYNVTVRRHFNFAADDAVAYGYALCDKVRAGESYAQVIGDAKGDVTPNDEDATNYLVSYSVNLLCPDQIWQLRNSAAGYQPSPS